jgi:hypothetical protein
MLREPPEEPIQPMGHVAALLPFCQVDQFGFASWTLGICLRYRGPINGLRCSRHVVLLGFGLSAVCDIQQLEEAPIVRHRA